LGTSHESRAKDVLASAAELLPEPHSTALHADRALVNALLGDFDSVLRIGKPLLERKNVPPLIRLKVLVSYTLAQGMRGRLDDFETLIAEALGLVDTYRVELPMAPVQIGLNHAFGLTALGRIDRAVEVSAVGYERALGEGNLAALWGGEHGEALVQAGFIPDAIGLLAQNQRQMGDFDPFRTNPMFLGVEAAARAMVRDTDRAERLLERAEREAMSPDPRYQTRFGRARGWLAFHAGDAEQAVQILATTGKRAVGATHVLWGCEVLHDAVRLGFPEKVSAELRAAVSETVGAEYLSAMAAHATALEVGDAEAVESAGKRFRKCGARLLAAEALAQSATLFHANGDQSAAHRTATWSTIWQRECGNPATPAFIQRPLALSDREFEIASLVANQRLTSPQVASQLFVSARTVDNHLRSIYRKLDVKNRDALAVFWARAQP
jgi:DNA-binding CsgD family transcriptional regulator